MTTVDVAIVAALIVGLLRGFTTGLVRQVIGLAGFIIALILAIEFMVLLGDAISSATGLGEIGGRIAAFLLIFVAAQIGVAILARLAEAVAGALRLTILNRLGGGAAGAAKALLLVSIGLVLLARLDIPSEESRRQSLLYGPTVLIVPTAWDLAASAWPRIRTMSDRFGDEVRSVVNREPRAPSRGGEIDASPRDPR